MKKIKEELKKVFESKKLTRLLNLVWILLVALIIFSAGMITGFNKASFSKTWDEHYEKNFGMGDRDDFMGGVNKMGMGLFPNAHGAIGKIIKLELPNVIVQDKDGTEKIIVTNDDTNIERVRDFIETTELKVDDFIIVVGSPNNFGQIDAKFIRVIPSPDLLQTTNTNIPTNAQ